MLWVVTIKGRTKTPHTASASMPVRIPSKTLWFVVLFRFRADNIFKRYTDSSGGFPVEFGNDFFCDGQPVQKLPDICVFPVCLFQKRFGQDGNHKKHISLPCRLLAVKLPFTKIQGIAKQSVGAECNARAKPVKHHVCLSFAQSRGKIRNGT